MVAHRLYTVTGADQLVVVNRGRIEAVGKHQELLEACPLYRQMWTTHLNTRDDGGDTGRMFPVNISGNTDMFMGQ